MNVVELLGNRVLFVHAHPDDETLQTGALIAACANHGIDTTVVTCTRGELGEIVQGVIPSDSTVDELAAHREGELERAVAVLGLSRHHWLGQAPARQEGLPDRRYSDSGMVWLSDGVAGPAEHIGEQSFVAAPEQEVVADLARLIRSLQPDTVLSYDRRGSYSHPDHVKAHEVTKAAAALTGVPFVEFASDLDDTDFVRYELGEYLDVVVDALREYRSQLTVYPDHIEHVGGQREEFYTAVGLRHHQAPLQNP